MCLMKLGKWVKGRRPKGKSQAEIGERAIPQTHLFLLLCPFLVLFARGTIARHETDLGYRTQRKILGALHEQTYEDIPFQRQMDETITGK